MIHKIPLYLEITLPIFSGDELVVISSKIRERKQPIILNLNLRTKEEALFFLEALKTKLGIKTNRDLLPYPIYLLADDPVQVAPFLCFKLLGELPVFYRRDQKRLTSKEANLLNNIQIVHDKISNLNLKEKFSLYEDYLEKNKVLNAKILENRFLEDLLEGIKKNE